METNDLMKSLERMKSVLTDIQSAEQQVESTVNAYDALSKKLGGVVDAMNNLSDGLSDIIKKIQDDYKDKLKQITTDSDKTITSSKNVISKLESSIETFNEVVNQKMQEQEQYFVNTAKKQKQIIFLLITNIVVVLFLLFQVFIAKN